MHSLDIFGKIVFYGGYKITELFDLGAHEILMNVLCLGIAPRMVDKALYAISNVIQDDYEHMWRVVVDNGGELFKKCLELLNDSLDAINHINALSVINGFILLEHNEDQ